MGLFEKREFIIKFKEKTSKKYGKNPYERNFLEHLEKGYVLIDKDVGPTSSDVILKLKNILGIKKAGHSGTLDPMVSGVLICGLNKATKLMEYMLHSNKEYVCLMYLHKTIKFERIKECVEKNFIGKIKQLPPVVSAVKRQLRERTIFNFEFLDRTENNRDILFRVKCQHGTYIRKLCSDIGDKLKCGGQMKELRRTRAGGKNEFENLISLDKLHCFFNLYDEELKKNYPKKIYIATSNKSKLERCERIFSFIDKKIKIEIIPNFVEVEENGKTNCENSFLKLKPYLKLKSKFPIITHDSEIHFSNQEFNPSHIKREVLKQNNLSDENISQEKIALLMKNFYRNLAKKNGGKLDFYFSDSFSILNPNGEIKKFKSIREATLFNKEFCELNIYYPLQCIYKNKITRKNYSKYNEKDFQGEFLNEINNFKNVFSHQNIYEKELRKYIKPQEELVKKFKFVVVRDSCINSLCCGADLAIPGLISFEKKINVGEEIAVFSQKEELVGIGICKMNSINMEKNKKGFCIKMKKILMNIQDYPKYWG